MKTSRTLQAARPDPTPAGGTGRAPAHDEVARRAYELWQQEGCPEGHALKHWIEAEKQLHGLRLSAVAESAVLESLRT